MKQTNAIETHRAVTAPLDASTNNTPNQDVLREQSECRSLPEVSRKGDEPDFPEGHEDPAQSEELERQQDA